MKKTLVTLMMVAMAIPVAFSAEGDAVNFDTGYTTTEGTSASAFADRGVGLGTDKLDYNNTGSNGGAVILAGAPNELNYVGVTLGISDLIAQNRTADDQVFSLTSISVVGGGNWNNGLTAWNNETARWKVTVQVVDADGNVRTDFVTLVNKAKDGDAAHLDAAYINNGDGNAKFYPAYTFEVADGTDLQFTYTDSLNVRFYSLAPAGDGDPAIRISKMGDVGIGNSFTAAANATDGSKGVFRVASVVVPEPATATLSLLALAGLAARRRRK